MPIVLFILIKKKYGNKNFCTIISNLYLFKFLLISESNMQAFIIAFVLCSILIRIYPRYTNYILKVAIICILLGVVIIAIAKANTAMLNSESIYEKLSKTFQAYFQGVSNVSGIFNVYDPNKIETLLLDFYNMIPFRNTLFRGFNINGENLIDIYWRSNNVVAQIVPGIAQSYHYLGFVFAPLIPAILVIVAINSFKSY